MVPGNAAARGNAVPREEGDVKATRFDLAARRIARLDPLGFFNWLLTHFEQLMVFVGWLDPRSAPESGDAEVTGDTVARLEELAVAPPWMFPVEFQTVPDPGMFGRLQRQIGEWWHDLRPDDLPDSRYQVSAAVVNLTGTSQSALASRLYRFPTDGLTWGGQVRERYLAEESADQTLARVESGELRPSILVLIPVMQGAGEPSIIRRWVVAAAKEPDARRADLAALALTLASLKEWFDTWKEALKGWNMQESQFVLELQAEARRETTLQTKRNVLKMLGEERFGELPADMLDRLKVVTDLERLDQLLRAVVRVSRLEELPL
jgi:hypothetical protein